MSNVLVLGSGWVGSAVAAAARAHTAVDAVHVVDPPFDPLLAPRDAAATTHLRTLVADGAVSAVVNACGRVQGTDDELADANVHFVQWLCNALEDTSVRLVHVGSASEYGDPGSHSPVTESSPAAPVGPYASTKAAGTDVVLDVAQRGRDATVARVFNIVGHPIPAVSPIHQWLTDLAELGPGGGEVVVWWPPTTRDFVMIEDVARALVDLATSPGAPPPLVNVCSGVGLRFGDIVGALAVALGVPATVRSLDRPGIEAVVGDPTMLGATIGWVPTMSAAALAQRAVGATSPSGGAAGASR
jgi:nucleoside-diphosphate-sugar epimerase